MDIYYTEQRGRLHYMAGAEIVTFDGWVCLSADRRTVTARKIGGRNRWRVCNIKDVLDFEVTRKEAAKK
jgi:hypothetical protein